MLNLWRRHLKSCPHRVRTYKKCGCPIWVQGTLHGKWLKKSLDVRNWESAQRIVRDWESGHAKSAEHSTTAKACDAFIRDCEARNLSSASIGKYRLLTDELKKEFEGRAVGSLSVDEVPLVRKNWNPIVNSLKAWRSFAVDLAASERTPVPVEREQVQETFPIDPLPSYEQRQEPYITY